MSKKESFLTLMKNSEILVLGNYSGAIEPIEVVGNCGHNIIRTPQVIKRSLKRGPLVCKNCRYSKSTSDRKKTNKEIFDKLKEGSSICTSKEYVNIDTHMSFICECTAKFTRSFYQARKSIDNNKRNLCISCERQSQKVPENKLTIEYIQEKLGEYSAKLLSDKYINSKDKISFIGSCGHTDKRRWNDIYKSISIYGEVLCSKCGRNENRKIFKTSKGEDELSNFIESLGFLVSRSKRPRWALGKEIDIQIEGTNLAVEYNGEYWHSEQQGKGRNYHLLKEEHARGVGVNLLQIFESEWRDKQEIIKSIISSKLNITTRIYGRKTTISKISAKTAKKFYDKNHRQGGAGATSSSYCLLSGDEVVSVMSIKKIRFGTNNGIEIYRFANKLNTTIIGGFSKLLAEVKKQTSGDIISYADLRFTDLNSNVYRSNGFELSHIAKPGYSYTRGNSGLINRMNFQKHKLKDKLEKFNPKKTEYENMLMNGYDRVWDCGVAVYRIER